MSSVKFEDAQAYYEYWHNGEFERMFPRKESALRYYYTQVDKHPEEMHCVKKVFPTRKDIVRNTPVEPLWSGC